MLATQPGGTGAAYAAMTLRKNGRPLFVHGVFATNTANHEYGVPTLLDCADGNCASGTPRVLDATERHLRVIRMTTRPNGRNLITWGEAGGAKTLYLYQCANRDCSSGRIAATLPNVDVDYGLAMRGDGIAVIAFRPSASGTVKLAFCGLPHDLIFANDFEMP